MSRKALPTFVWSIFSNLPQSLLQQSMKIFSMASFARSSRSCTNVVSSLIFFLKPAIVLLSIFFLLFFFPSFELSLFYFLRIVLSLKSFENCCFDPFDLCPSIYQLQPSDDVHLQVVVVVTVQVFFSV